MEAWCSRCLGCRAFLYCSHTETERIFGKHTNILKNVLSFKLPSTCRWVRACWRSSPCACEAAGSDFLSRISAGWAIHSSQCEGSPQSAASLSLLFSRILAFHASQSLLQSHKDPFEVRHQKTHFWTHKSPSLWYPQSLVWTCWLWSEWAVPGGLIQSCDTSCLVSSLQGSFFPSSNAKIHPWMRFRADRSLMIYKSEHQSSRETQQSQNVRLTAQKTDNGPV